MFERCSRLPEERKKKPVLSFMQGRDAPVRSWKRRARRQACDSRSTGCSFARQQWDIMGRSHLDPRGEVWLCLLVPSCTTRTQSCSSARTAIWPTTSTARHVKTPRHRQQCFCWLCHCDTATTGQSPRASLVPAGASGLASLPLPPCNNNIWVLKRGCGVSVPRHHVARRLAQQIVAALV